MSVVVVGAATAVSEDGCVVVVSWSFCVGFWCSGSDVPGWGLATVVSAIVYGFPWFKWLTVVVVVVVVVGDSVGSLN